VNEQGRVCLGGDYIGLDLKLGESCCGGCKALIVQHMERKMVRKRKQARP